MTGLIYRFFHKTGWWFIVIALVWLGGLQWFATLIPTSPNPTNAHADAIVVLTGGKNRLEYGAQLLAEGRAEKLFISGVHEDITEQQLVNLVPAELRTKVIRLGDNAITLGREAWNTIGNAEETKRWLADQKVGSILLVTSNYHMPRSYYEFRHLVKGVNIIPMPVPADDYDPATWWANSRYRELVFSEYHKYIAAMARNALVPMVRSL